MGCCVAGWAAASGCCAFAALFCRPWPNCCNPCCRGLFGWPVGVCAPVGCPLGLPDWGVPEPPPVPRLLAELGLPLLALVDGEPPPLDVAAVDLGPDGAAAGTPLAVDGLGA